MKPALVTLAIALVFAAPAAAERPPLPTPETHRIQVASKIGGVGLGGDLEAANEAWGGQGRCGSPVLPQSCYWGDFYDDRDGRAEVLAESGVVDGVFISWNGVLEEGRPDVAKRVAKFRTRTGIRLGSKLDAVARAYPGAEPIEHPSNGRVQAYVIHRGDAKMWFGGGKFVTYISLLPE